MNELVRNSIITPDGTVLISKTKNDYVSHLDKNGNSYAIDGGLHFFKIFATKDDYTPNYIYIKDNIKIVREVLSWGTYGKNGDEPYKEVLLKDMTLEHIKAILKTQKQISINFKKCLEAELFLRNYILKLS